MKIIEKLLMATQSLAFTIYNTLAQQVEQAKLKVQEQTPVVSVLQPVQVPVEDETSGLNIIIGVTLLGFLSTITFLIIHYLYQFNAQK